MQMEGRSNDEGGDGKDEGQKDENHVQPGSGDERLREGRHPLLSEENLGGEESHVGRGWQLPWPQQVQGFYVEVPGLPPGGEV